MSNEELIQALKENSTPFCMLLSDQLRKAKSIGWRSFSVMTVDGNGFGAKWIPADGDFYPKTALTYRLSPDYKEEPEIVECEIYEQGKELYYTYYPTGTLRLCCAVGSPDFIGFKYEANLTDTSPRLYKSVVDGNTKYRTSILTDEVPGWEVLTPTHVLFRKATT